MSRSIHIHIGEPPRAVGTLDHEQRGARESASFEYAPEWLQAEDRFAIDPTLALVRGPQFHKRTREGSLFHNAFADCEPDGWARRIILRDHRKRREEGDDVPPVLNELDFLLAVDDFSRVGALRFQNENGEFVRTFQAGRRTAPPLIELSSLFAASRAVETNTETAQDLAYLRGRGTSLGGRRPKCTVIDDSGQLFIGKFPSVQDERPVTKSEVLALNLAALAKIDVADARLIDVDAVQVALIRRFDRDGLRRTPYASAATMMGVDPHDGAEHAYTEVVDAIRVHGDRVQADIEELWRRMAFTVLITNVDDHLMNHGFLYVGKGRWRLSPAFDINPFPDRHRELKLWVSEEAGPGASVDSLLSVIRYFRLTLPRAKEILRDVFLAVQRWRAEGARLGMSNEELDQFKDAFEHEETRAAAQVVA